VRFRAGELATAVTEARKAMWDVISEAPPSLKDIEDPEALLERTLSDALGIRTTSAGSVQPVVVVAVGDLDEEAALVLLEMTFSDMYRHAPLDRVELRPRLSERRATLPGKAQSQIGYAVPVPSSPIAWRMLLYILAHDYEGRLGKELIARRGLLYYLGTRHHTDGKTGWISITAGVSPDKLDETRTLFFGLLDALRENPPTEAEVEEAKRHLIGRRLTAPMSNEELTAAYAREWMEFGQLLTNDEWERGVRAIHRDQVLHIVPKFLAGVRGAVDVRGTSSP